MYTVKNYVCFPHNYCYCCYTHCEFFIPALAVGLSLEFEWQQVFLGPQISSDCFGRSIFFPILWGPFQLHQLLLVPYVPFFVVVVFLFCFVLFFFVCFVFVFCFLVWSTYLSIFSLFPLERQNPLENKSFFFSFLFFFFFFLLLLISSYSGLLAGIR